MVLALQIIDRRPEGRALKPLGAANVPFRSLAGPGLYLSVMFFNLLITFTIGEIFMGVTGLFILILPLSLVMVSVVRRINRYGKEDLAQHLADYPWSAVSGRRG
jgi:putative membrane protein